MFKTDNNKRSIDNNKQIQPIQRNAAGIPLRKIESHSGGVNTINTPIQPNLPFGMNPQTNRRSMGLFMSQDRQIVSEQERQRAIAVAAAAGGGGSSRVYHNFKTPDVMIPLQRQDTVVGIQGHKQFGMRSMFM